MVAAQTRQVPKSGLFLYLLVLTAIFVLLEISFTLQGSGLYLADVRLISEHISIPTLVYRGIFFYLFVQFMVHVFFTIVVWALARCIGFAFQCSWSKTQDIGFVLWGLALITLLLYNQYFFPNSKFSSLMDLFFSRNFAKHILFLIVVFEGLFLLILIGRLLYVCRKLLWVPSIILWSLLLVPLFYVPCPLVLNLAASATKPNVIIIGVDSLRPDFLGYFGRGNTTPYMDDFLNQASVFSEALTPLARTYPSWISLLTGTYPKISGARTDLGDQSALNMQDSLPQLLQNNGYETIYAMDETRFSNIETAMGFQRVVTPPVGFNDFLLGTFNDFPLSNFLVNSALGKVLFPYSYANRAAFVTYDPNSFLKLLAPVLNKKLQKPLFLAVHFCLPHYPYFWSVYSPSKSLKAKIHYRATVHRVDEQVHDLLTLLAQHGFLEHAIVILLSDHGEALEFDGDRITSKAGYIGGKNNPQKTIPPFYPPSFDFETVSQSAGHGTDVLGLAQYHAVLAFRAYGCCQIKPGTISGIVSLLDIKPTLLDILHISDRYHNGFSLRASMQQGDLLTNSQKDFFMESDFSPQAVRTVHPETRQLLFQGIDYFQINSLTAKITVKKTMADMINSSKQFADIYGNWILALYPQADKKMVPILVNLVTGQWTNDLATTFAQHSPAVHMLQALNNFFVADLSDKKLE